MNPFNKYAYYHRRMSSKPVRSSNTPTPDDQLLFGVKSLSEQIATYRAGGLGLGTRSLSESNYDEDDVTDVDPSSELGLDRFERAEAITDQISERMEKKHKDKLSHASV